MITTLDKDLNKWLQLAANAGTETQSDEEEKSFPGHKGRPGQHGGSLPRNASGAMQPSKAPAPDEIPTRDTSMYSDEVASHLSGWNIQAMEGLQRGEAYSKLRALFDDEILRLYKKNYSSDHLSDPEAKAQWDASYAGRIGRFQYEVESQALGKGYWDQVKYDGKLGEEVRSYVKHNVVKTLSAKTGVDYDTVNAIVGQWADTSNKSYSALSLQEAATEEFGLELSDWQKEALKPSLEAKDKITKVLGAESIAKLHSLQQRSEVLANDMDKYRYDSKKFDTLYSERKDVERDILALKSSMLTKAKVDLDSGASFLKGPVADRETERKVLRAMYEHTQEVLKSQGIEEVLLYRGVRRKKDATIDGRTKKVKMYDWKPGDVIDYKGNTMESWAIHPDVAVDFGSLIFAVKVPRQNVISTSTTGFGCLVEGEFVVLDTLQGAQARILIND